MDTNNEKRKKHNIKHKGCEIPVDAKELVLEDFYGFKIYITKSGEVYTPREWIDRKPGGYYKKPKKKGISDNGNGYKTIMLTRTIDGIKRQKRFYVHRLVARAFIGPIAKGMVINHIDYNKANNNVENIEIVNQKQNIKHSIPNRKKFSYEVVKNIINLHLLNKLSVFEIYEETKVARKTIESILKKESDYYAEHCKRYEKETGINIEYRYKFIQKKGVGGLKKILYDLKENKFLE